MSDERLRAIERRWRETGADADLEALMFTRERAGDFAEAAADGRRLLESNVENENARAIVARYAPLLWTGTVSVQQEPGNDNLDPPTLVCREAGEEHVIDLSPLPIGRGSQLHLAYAGNRLALLHSYYHGAEARYQRMDITPAGKQNVSDIQRPDAAQVDHNTGNMAVRTITQQPGGVSFALHTSTHPQIMAAEGPPHQISELVDCVQEPLFTSGQSPWIQEDGRIAFSDFTTTDFLETTANRARDLSYDYGRTRVPAWSRLHRKINRAATEGDLANVYHGLQRNVVEVPITILNALRRMR